MKVEIWFIRRFQERKTSAQIIFYYVLHMLGKNYLKLFAYDATLKSGKRQ